MNAPGIPPTWTEAEFEAAAAAVLPRGVFDFAASGAGRERTVAANRTAFERRTLVPRVLRAAGEPDLSRTVLGTSMLAPILLAPIGGQRMYHPEGERATAAAARDAGVGYVLSTAASVELEAVAEVAGTARWMQIYWQPDAGVVADLIARAKLAGYRAICVTVDWPARPLRPRDVRNGFQRPDDIPFANLERYGTLDRDLAHYGELTPDPIRVPPAPPGAPAVGAPLDWRALAWVRGITTLPLLAKGILCGEDARLAVDIGVDGIVVSNHGGRYLDGVPASLDALAEVREAVGEAATVLLDGGVRDAHDVLVACATGASAVLLGRPMLWALACAGRAGVSSWLANLTDDLCRTMTFLGLACLDEIGPELIRQSARCVAGV